MSGEKDLRPKLLAWFDREKRELPWRGRKDPYAVWVSEVMLQQTTVQTVLPRFEPFLRRFPTIAALARARPDAVLAAWSGLGYYARARNLHRAARIVVDRHRGRLPDTEEGLRTLPGMGEYMAQAVAAIAFGRRTLPMEANVRRVVSRLFATAEPEARVAEVFSASRPGDSVAAIFDLGQTICRPRHPDCARCPVSSRCAALRLGSVGDFPVRPKRPAARPFFRCVAAAVSPEGRVLLRRRRSGFLSGMWELPGEEGESLAAARARFRRRFPGAASRSEGTVEQPIAGRRVRVEIYRARAVAPEPGDRWMSAPQIERSATPSLTKKIVRKLSRAADDRRTIEK
jgi:A/G-specific adenine glycosylase